MKETITKCNRCGIDCTDNHTGVRTRGKQKEARKSYDFCEACITEVVVFLDTVKT